ncbi:hypothetical protein KEHDKFFH_19925 [Marinobacter maroccanus]|uniref:Uncharacterized protein n=1 Tax=Marinobacter maroccanus TaxID=2055143 RepID=A0A2S5Z4S7_9GAMM|nr:hypothetical protein [Marinobacter maroccanus]PPI82373.1 hypothetical protein KEHDKFFH_19925 [Marinobacter maroccanus]
MDTLIYLRSAADLAMYDDFELANVAGGGLHRYSVFGVAGKRRDSLGDFVTRRHAVLFAELCESTRDLRRQMQQIKFMRRDRHASL